VEGELVYLKDSAATGSAPKGDGTILYLEHSQDGVFGGFNKLAVVFGDKQGSYGFNEPVGAYRTGPASGHTWRIIEQLSWDVTNTGWTGTATAVYAKHSEKNDWNNPKTWFSIGVRPQYNFTDIFSIASELGYDNVKTYDATDSDRKLWKLTVAPQLALSRGVWARPVLRAFVTYAKWNDAATRSGIANGAFGTSNNGMTYGFQAEAWW
jgi:maltoporin